MNSNFNTIEETRAGYSLIEKHALESDGIIYGGYLRDEVIKDECTSKFMKLFKNERIEKYWDKTYHPETLDRLLIPNDIDISFKTDDDLKTFIKKIRNENLFKIKKIKIEEENDSYGSYGCDFLNITRYKAVSFLGKTFINKGHIIIFNIDVCISYTNPEPPFHKCDMYSNCLVKDKNGIRLSNNSGIFDRDEKLKPHKAVMLTVKVIESIIKKETYVTIDNVDSESSAKNAIKRILKMVSKDFTIKNISWLNKCKDKSEVCVICQNEEAEISIKRGSHFHKKCLIEFFDHVEFSNDNGGYFFNSPLKEKCYMRFVKEWNYE